MTNNQVQYLWIIPLLPLAGFLINGLAALCSTGCGAPSRTGTS